MKQGAHHKLLLTVDTEALLLESSGVKLVDVVGHQSAILGHVPGVAGIVWGSLVDCGCHGFCEGPHLLLKLIPVAHIGDGNRSLT